MLEDIPYQTLRQDEQAYEIMLLRDQQQITFSALSKQYKISYSRVIQLYHCLKSKQRQLYMNHISLVLGFETTNQIRAEFYQAFECYQSNFHACAYLEQKYCDILTPYRDGEPGLPEQFLKNLPPFKRKLSKQAISRIIEMREAQAMPFAVIAAKLQITPEKARHAYDSYYHKKAMVLVEALQMNTQSDEEKLATWVRSIRENRSSKKRYDLLTKE